MKLKETLMAWNRILGKIEDWILVLVVGLMTALLVYNVFSRFVLGSSLQFAEEVGSFLLVTVSYIGCISAVRKSKHIRMVLLSDHLSFHKAYILTMVNLLIPAFAFLGFGFLCIQIMMVNYHSGRTFMTFQMDRWIIWIPVVVGLFGTALQYLLVFIYNAIDYKNMKGKEDIWVGSEVRYGDSSSEGC